MATNSEIPQPPRPGAHGGPFIPGTATPPRSAPPPHTGAYPATPAAAPRRTGLLVATLVIAVLALVVGMAGVVISAIALGRSDKAVASVDNPAQPVAPPAATVDAPRPTEPTTAPTSGEPTETSSPGEISPTAEFVTKYQGQHLRVQSPNCQPGYRTAVDLDEPRVLTGGEGDITYGGCTPGTVDTGLQFAEVSGQTATPADCLETIRTSPAQSPVAPSNGLTLCFLTSQNAAAAEGITQKVVLVTLDSITENNDHGILNITLKAWDVPE